MEHQFGWTMIVIGVLIVLVGVLLLAAPSIPWLGRLPGDIRIERENSRFYFPLTTCILLSILLSVAVWIWQIIGR